MAELIKIFLYLGRWQLSSPILAIFMAGTVAYLSKAKIKWPTRAELAGAVVANLIGGMIFFWVDRLIFN